MIFNTQCHQCGFFIGAQKKPYKKNAITNTYEYNANITHDCASFHEMFEVRYIASIRV